MDPLSDVLSLLKPRIYASGGFDVAGPMALQFPAHQGIKCYAVSQGTGWLEVEGTGGPVRLSAGDCFLLPRGRPFRLATHLDAEPVDAMAMFAARRAAAGGNPGGGQVFTHNGGGDVCIVGGHFALDGDYADILLSVLPPIVHIRSEADRAVLRWSVERMMDELREPQPGGLLVVRHLAQMMLVLALRLHMAEGPSGGVGWLFALGDKQMGAAIGAMHAAPAHPWTLQTLAERAGMSRSTFAQKFKATVGSSPMEYLTRWRMLVAGDRLTHSSQPVSAIALALGYESESAFSTAFKRVMGSSPRRYGRGRAEAAASHAPAERELEAVG